MAIFILAPQTDAHAVSIEWGLRKAGYEVVHWEGLSWQPERHAALSVMADGGVYLAGRKIEPQDTVWFRRPQPTVQHPGTSVTERKFAGDEYRKFYSSLLLGIEWTGAFCINKWSAAVLIENKAVQLLLARHCGLLTPTTMMTNSSDFVDKLFDAVPGGIVHKAFLPHMWIDTVARMEYYCETTSMDRSFLYSDEVFAYAPGIYQQEVKKRYDVRITMVGGTLHAFAVMSARKMLDWRLHAMQSEVSVERVALPLAVEKGLREFADHAGIVFGCFDMSVDQEDKWWFLEVNQAGQFLWIDDLCPDDGLYRPMLEFLSAREATVSRYHNQPFASYRQCLAECQGARVGIVPLTDDSPYCTIERRAPQSLATHSN